MRCRRASMPKKESEKSEEKREQGREGETQPGQLIHLQGMKKRTENRINREWDLNPATQDHLVASYDLHGSYSGLTLKPLSHTGITNIIPEILDVFVTK